MMCINQISIISGDLYGGYRIDKKNVTYISMNNELEPCF